MKIDHVLAMLVACFATLVTTLFLVDTHTVFDPPYLLPLLNTLFLAIIPCIVAYTAARLFLSFGSVPLLILGKGMLALGFGGAVSGWFIGSPAGPNTTITIYNSGALLCACLNAYSALALARNEVRPLLNRPLTILISILLIAAIIGFVILAAVTGISPPFIIQGVGPTLVGKAVLVGAILMFMAAAALIFLNKEVSGLSLFRCYAVGLVLMAIGLTGVLLQHYVGSPLGWAGRFAQYAGAFCILNAIAGLWRKKFTTGKSLTETAEEIARERLDELEKLATKQDELILQNEERLKLALDAAHLATWDWDILTDTVIWNNEHYRMLGYEPGSFEPTYQHWADRLHPDDLRSTEENIRNSMTSGKDYRTEFRVVLPDGEIRTMESLGRFEHDSSGRAVRCFGAMSDITARARLLNELKQAQDDLEKSVALRTEELLQTNINLLHEINDRKQIEHELSHSKEALAEAQAISHVGSWQLKYDAKREHWSGSEELYRIYGYPPSMPLTMETGLDRMHPDDLELVKTAWAAALEGSGPNEWEHRIIVDGKIKWLSVKVKINFDSEGHPSGATGIVQDISSLKLAEVEREQFYKFFQTSADIMVIADPNGALMKINPAVSELLGYSEAELVSKPFIDFVHPDDKQPTLIEFAHQQLSGSTMSFVNRYLCKDGSIRWLSWRAVYNKTENLAFAVGRDIGDRIKQEQELRSSVEEFRLLAEAMPQIVWITRPDGWNIYFNQQWMDYTGLTLEESMGHGWNKPFHPEDQQVAWDAWQYATQNLDTYSLECRLRRADGAYKWWLIRGVPVFDDQGTVIKWFGTCTDIDEFKKAEEERHSLEKQLLHAQKLESLGILAGGIAHDFNNILMAILGNAELARMKMAPESPLVTNLQQIEQAAMRAADLARQMLAYSGKGKFHIVRLDINHLIDEMKSMLEVSISRKALLKLSLAPNLPAVEADPSQIQQIIMNLVINASEAIGDESGYITIKTGSMECTADYLTQLALNENMAEGSYVYLEITDTGCGMDRETLSRIFDPFFTTKFTGRGLGMAAVHGIVRGHKGGINIYSETGKGTTFKVLLPASGKPAKNTETNVINEDWQGSGRVLLVDDEEIVRNIGSEMLKELGVTVMTAKDGVDAIKLYKSGVDFTCVILDLTMPRMDGEQCFRELRKIDPEAKIIMSSGYSELEIAKRFVNMGVTGFIQKPYTFSLLQKMLKSVL